MQWILYLIKRIFWQWRTWLKRRAQPYYLKVNLHAPMPLWPTEKPKWYVALIKGKNPTSIFEIQRGLRRRLDEAKCQGVYLYVGDLILGPSELNLWIDFLKECRRKNHATVIWAKHFDASSYALARYCDRIVLQPGGSIASQGLYRELFFWRRSLAKLGIEAQVVAVSPYKSAMDMWSCDQASAAVKETQYRLMDAQIAFQKRMWTEASQDPPKKKPLETQELIDNTPATDTEALQAHWITEIASEEKLVNQLKAQLVNWHTPRLRPQRPEKKTKIAVLQLEGIIVDGPSQHPPFSLPLPIVGDKKLGDETASALIHRLVQRKDVSGCVVYINSPGGSASASAAIGTALNALKANMPVYALMGNVAASGGYWIASEAQRIFAHPLTLTGSIGVIGAKFLVADLLEKLATGREVFERGVNAGLYSPLRKWDDAQRAQMEKMIQHTYQAFLDHVSQTRDISVEKLIESAQGKVWTGEEAQTRGLVDDIGDLQAACAHMAHNNQWQKWEVTWVHPKASDKAPLMSPFQAYGQTLRLLQQWQDKPLVYTPQLGLTC